MNNTTSLSPPSVAPRSHARFEIHADPSTQLVAKLAGVLVIHDVTIVDFHARRSAGGMWISVDTTCENQVCERLGARIGEIIGVCHVLWFPLSA